MLAIALLTGVVVTAAVERAAAAPGGRVQLQPPQRIGDTRDTGGGARVTNTGLGDGILRVSIVDATASGAAFVHRCVDAAGPVPTLTYDAGDLSYVKVASSDPMCLTATSPVHVVIDRFGSVDAAPSGAGLQYVPAPAAQVVFDAVVSAGSGESVPVDLGPIPADARAAVVLIEVNDPISSGHSVVYPCDRPALYTDVAWRNDRAVGIAYVETTAGDVCLRSIQEAGIRLTVLGHLSVDGPDPTRLPPTLSAPLGDVRLPGLRAITPTRLVDSREGLGTPRAERLTAGDTLEVEIDDAAESTVAVALNVTVTDPDDVGYLTVFPCDQARPTASNLNYVAGETVANLVNVKISVTRTVCFYAQRATHLVVDLAGTFERAGGAGMQPSAPLRLLDTRSPIGVPAGGKAPGGTVLTLQVAGRGGVPETGASAVTMNVTVTEPDDDGFLTVYPCDRPRPTASNLNYVAGQTVPNLVSVRLSAAGTVCLFTQRTTHLVADLAGWYSIDEDDGFRELAPDRLLDTRVPVGVATAAKLASGNTLVLQVADRGGVPASGATAVTMNVTVTEAEGDGFVTVYPCDADRPEASNLNHTSGETVPNLVTVQLAADGTVCLFAQRTVHLIADVAGYYTEVTEIGHVPTVG